MFFRVYAGVCGSHNGTRTCYGCNGDHNRCYNWINIIRFPGNILVNSVKILNKIHFLDTLFNINSTPSSRSVRKRIKNDLWYPQTKWDFTIMAGGLVSLLMVLIFFGIFCAIFPNKIMETMYSSLGVLVFSFFIVFDTQMMMGGNHR